MSNARIKNEVVLQMMQLPPDSTVMLRIEDEDENEIHYRDVRETPYVCCLALVRFEYSDGNIYTGVSLFDLTNNEVIDDSSYVVRLPRCPVCGEYMTPTGDCPGSEDIRYVCKCGAEKKAFGTELIEPTNRPGLSEYSFGY